MPDTLGEVMVLSVIVLAMRVVRVTRKMWMMPGLAVHAMHVFSTPPRTLAAPVAAFFPPRAHASVLAESIPTKAAAAVTRTSFAIMRFPRFRAQMSINGSVLANQNGQVG